MRKLNDILYLGMCFNGYVDFCNKLNHLESLGYKSNGLSLKSNKTLKEYKYKYIYISFHTNKISIGKFFFLILIC